MYNIYFLKKMSSSSSREPTCIDLEEEVKRTIIETNNKLGIIPGDNKTIEEFIIASRAASRATSAAASREQSQSVDILEETGPEVTVTGNMDFPEVESSEDTEEGAIITYATFLLETINKNRAFISASAVTFLLQKYPSILNHIFNTGYIPYFIPLAIGSVAQLISNKQLNESIMRSIERIKETKKEIKETGKLTNQLISEITAPISEFVSENLEHLRESPIRQKLYELKQTARIHNKIGIFQLIEIIELKAGGLTPEGKDNLYKDLDTIHDIQINKVNKKLNDIVDKYWGDVYRTDPELKKDIDNYFKDPCVGGGGGEESGKIYPPTVQPPSSSKRSRGNAFSPQDNYGSDNDDHVDKEPKKGGKSRKHKSMRKTSKSGKKTRKSKKSNKRNTRK